jgi:hypothetical protein
MPKPITLTKPSVADLFDAEAEPPKGKMGVYEFGEQLLKTNDLDPVYVALGNAGLDDWTLRKWLLAYWCFYHAGTASWIVDQESYWKAMWTAAADKMYPRCHERRHFRGDNALKSMADLEARGLTRAFRPLTGKETKPLSEVMAFVQTWRGFGPWIAFKVADMVERLGLLPVDFGDGGKFMYESPAAGAALLWESEIAWDAQGPDVTVPWAVNRILNELGHYTAPPRYERFINIQEAETILCKWKSYMGGHYALGEDVSGLLKSLGAFRDSPTARTLIVAATMHLGGRNDA